MPRLWTATTWQGSPITVFDRIEGVSGANITQASVASIIARFYYDSSGQKIGSDYVISIADSIFDTLQDVTDDSRYTGDDGFNFRVLLPGAYFRPLPGSGGDDTLITVFIQFVDTNTPPNTVYSAGQITAKQVLGVRV